MPADFQNHCEALQEALGNAKAPNHGRRFKLVCVEPLPDDSAFVHIMPYGPQAFGYEDGANPVAIAEQIIAASPLRSSPLELHWYDLLNANWPIPLSKTTYAREIPVIIATQDDKGRVRGVWGWDAHIGGSIEALVGTCAVEFADAESLVRNIAAGVELPAGFEMWGTVSGDSLEEAAGQAPASAGDQRSLLVYRDNQWLSGLLNGPLSDFPGLTMSAVAEYHVVPVSKALLASREDLANAIQTADIKSDGTILTETLTLFHRAGDDCCVFGDYESHPAVAYLCRWWNDNAPEELRSAGSFRLYVWDADKKIFAPCDPEEPPMLASTAAKLRGRAIFAMPGGQTAMALFLRGKKHNTYADGAVSVYDTTGTLWWEVGATLDEYDEGYYAVTCLRLIAAILKNSQPARKR